MPYNDRKHRTSVQFEYPDQHYPVWRLVLDTFIILMITIAFVLIVVGCLASPLW